MIVLTQLSRTQKNLKKLCGQKKICQPLQGGWRSAQHMATFCEKPPQDPSTNASLPHAWFLLPTMAAKVGPRVTITDM